MSKLMSVESGTSAQTIAKMLNVLFPDAESVLDMTYGSGKFWTASPPWYVTGIDLNPSRARDVCADFTRLPFPDGAFDVAIFDPPYIAHTSKQGTGIIGRRFGSFATAQELEDTVKRGADEAWRVSKIGVICKVQNHTHFHRSIRMTKWIESVIPEEPYGEIHQLSAGKIIPARWDHQLSVLAMHTTFLAFRHGNQMHVRRGKKGATEALLSGPIFQLPLTPAVEAGGDARRAG